ncbi:hypothetical protein P692DRAFT_20824650 [Suillus brevipes Sb2]|jgi:hypothetical protein|nr:hypothetical protein P692DRAFT_20824650 [Suillus brevipes Sb2]
MSAAQLLIPSRRHLLELDIAAANGNVVILSRRDIELNFFLILGVKSNTIRECFSHLQQQQIFAQGPSNI